MAGPYPLATLACTIDATGISAPPYEDIFSSLQASFQLVYGTDAYIDPDSQDGQMIAIFASAINDNNAATIATYNAFSPASAVGAGLSSVVKINSIRRNVSSFSTADLTIVGQTGTVISNGIVSDTAGYQWALPATVTIDSTGSVVATATCTTVGAIAASEGTIASITTPTRGWQTASNTAAATPGAAVETDPALRIRQASSTSISANTTLEAIVANVLNVAGVETVQPYENDSGSTDGNGLPRNSISLVVVGGDATAIATAIATTKSPGTGTYGTTSEVIIDSNGVPDTINFFRPATLRVIASISITAKTGYVSTTGTALVAEVAAFVSGLGIGQEVDRTNVISAATLNNGPLSKTYKVEALLIAFYGNSLGTADLSVGFNESASLAVSDITLTAS
jgi:uncharacterized phage protein gp47/JayE